ncbi:MAG TPA: DUF1206 domain-containing protein [Micromonosporaceae bacterium]|nr:DUF1206 domain-containing protein [Micromonosporaceae bacterium]
MAPSNTAHQTAQRAAQSDVLEKLLRMGFVGYGLLHLAVAWLALQLALGKPGQESDQGGAFRALADQPFGKALLIAITVGLVAMALWQLLLAAIGHRAEQGFARTAERVGSGARTVIYAALAWTAGRVAFGTSKSTAQESESATAGIMERPAGQWLVGLIGLVVIAVGVGMVIYGLRRKFEKRLMINQMSAQTRKWARWLGQAGYAAKGVALGIVGLLLINAAVTSDPAKSRGLDSALRTLLEQPFGVAALIAVALGFAAFGLYCFLQAKYRKVTE